MRSKGTRYENRVRDGYLHDVFPNVDRAPLRGTQDYGDFTGIGDWLIEAKWRATPGGLRIPSWLQQIKHKVEEGAPWVLQWAIDRRKDPVDYVITDARLFWHMVRLLREHGHDVDTMEGWDA